MMEQIRKRLVEAMGPRRATDLAKMTGVSDSTVGRYLKSELDLSLEFVLKVCRGLGVSADWLLFGRGNMEEGKIDLAALSDQEIYDEFAARLKRMHGRVDEMLRAMEFVTTDDFKAMARAAGRHKIARLVEPGPALKLVDVEQLPADWPGNFVPVIGRIAAGKGVDTIEAESHPAGLSVHYLHAPGVPKSAFAVRVEGDSMEPQFRGGDMVIVDGGRHAQGGVCVVLQRTSGERVARLKKLSVRGRVAILASLNPNYKPIEVPAKEIEAFEIIRHLPATQEQKP